MMNSVEVTVIMGDDTVRVSVDTESEAGYHPVLYQQLLIQRAANAAQAFFDEEELEEDAIS